MSRKYLLVSFVEYKVGHAHHLHHHHHHHPPPPHDAISRCREPGSAAVALCDGRSGSARGPRRSGSGLHPPVHRGAPARGPVRRGEVVQGRRAAGVQSQRPPDQRPPQRHDAVVQRSAARGGAAGRVPRHLPAQRHVRRQRRVHVSHGGARGRAEPGEPGGPRSERLSGGEPADGHLPGCFRHRRADARSGDFPHQLLQSEEYHQRQKQDAEKRNVTGCSAQTAGRRGPAVDLHAGS